MNPTFLFVALIWFAAVALWRRLAGGFPWRVALFFYLVVLLFLFRPMTQQAVHLPMDYLFRINPWSDFRPSGGSQNPELNDLPLQIVPWAHQVRESWKNLEVPLWNASSAGGYPLLANGQSAALSVLRLIALPLPLEFAFTAEGALKLLIALGATFLFLRRRGASEEAAVIAAVSFAFATSIVIWLHFPLGTVSAWLPAVFLGIELLLEKRSFGRVVFLSLVFSQTLLGGHPETAAHIVFGAGLWLLYRVFVDEDAMGRGARERLAPVGAVCGAGLLGFALALPQVLPLLEALPSTKRWDVLEQFPDLYDRVTDARFLVNFIQPSFYGNVRDGTAWGPAHAEVIAGYGGILLAASWIGMLVWSVRGRRWRSEAFFLAIAIPVLVGIALNWPGVSDAFESLPLFSLAANGRLRLLVVWFGVMLAAQALDRMRAGDRWPLIAGAGAIAAALVLIFPLNRLDLASLPGESAIATTVPAMFVLVTLAAAAAVSRFRKPLLAALLVAVVADLWVQSFPINPVLPRSFFYPRTPILTRMMAIEAERRAEDPLAYRVTGTNGMLFPNTQVMFGLEDIRGHDPMANGRVLGVLRVFTGYSSDNYFGILRDVSHPLIDYLNVHYVMTSRFEELPAESWERVYAAPDGKIFRNRETLPRFFAVREVISEFEDEKRTRLLLEHQDWSSTAIVKRLPTRLMDDAAPDLFGEKAREGPVASVRLTQAEGDEFAMEIDAPRWTLIVSSQPDWPGWRVTRNGGEELKTIKVNAAFMGFLVPPGSSSVRVHYAPRSFWAGAWVAIAALTGVAVTGGVRRWREGALRRRKD